MFIREAIINNQSAQFCKLNIFIESNGVGKTTLITDLYNSFLDNDSQSNTDLTWPISFSDQNSCDISDDDWCIGFKSSLSQPIRPVRTRATVCQFSLLFGLILQSVSYKPLHTI